MKTHCNYFFMALLLILSSCIGSDDDDPVSYVAVGDRLPEFSVELSDGTVVSTQTLRGCAALIVFFNTDCPDCRRELPEVERLQEMNPAVTIVCIAREESAEKIAAYWAEAGLTLPYSPQPDRRIFNLFASSGIPRLYIADGQGTVTAVFGDTDYPTAEQLARLIP